MITPGPSSGGAGWQRPGGYATPSTPSGACHRQRLTDILADRVIISIGRLALALECVRASHRAHGCDCPRYPCVLDEEWARS